MANAHFAVVFASEWCSREDGDLLSMLGEEGESGCIRLHSREGVFISSGNPYIYNEAKAEMTDILNCRE